MEYLERQSKISNWNIQVEMHLPFAIVLELIDQVNLKKAFDTVDHSILLSKLQAYGIQGSTDQWFCS